MRRLFTAGVVALAAALTAVPASADTQRNVDFVVFDPLTGQRAGGMAGAIATFDSAGVKNGYGIEVSCSYLVSGTTVHLAATVAAGTNNVPRGTDGIKSSVGVKCSVTDAAGDVRSIGAEGVGAAAHTASVDIAAGSASVCATGYATINGRSFSTEPVCS